MTLTAPGVKPRRADPLYAYQRTGARFLASSPRALLLDDMGLGKSAQAIRGADIAGIKRLVVLCPAALKENWAREFARFQQLPRVVEVANGRRHRFNPRADVLVVNYDLLTAPDIKRQLRAFGAQGVILDEAHLLKNPDAQRTKAVLGATCSGKGGLVEHPSHAWALTGTPVPNHPGELWPLLRALAPQAITLNPAAGPLPQAAFIQRYCSLANTQFGQKITGGRNLDELRARIAPFVLRRTKDQVLTDLPPFRVETVLLSAGDAAAQLQRAEQTAGVAHLRQALWAAGADDLKVAQHLATAAPHVATLRRLTGVLKAPLVADLLEQELAAGLDKVVVFAVHREVIDILATRLLRFRPQVLDGRTPPALRQAAVDQFQRDPFTRVFIGQVTAAGTGITLTAACNAVFAETSWVPAENAQAAMRVHRIGQRNSVLVRIATVAGTVDEAVAGAVRRKARTIAQLLD